MAKPVPLQPYAVPLLKTGLPDPARLTTLFGILSPALHSHSLSLSLPLSSHDASRLPHALTHIEDTHTRAKSNVISNGARPGTHSVAIESIQIKHVT